MPEVPRQAVFVVAMASAWTPGRACRLTGGAGSPAIERSNADRISWPLTGRGLRCVAMAEIVLRVRLIGGEHLDAVYDEAGAAPDAIVDRIISILAQDDGMLRCRHGDRLILLYGRGVATLEVAPRGPVL